MPIKRGSVVLAALTAAWLSGTAMLPAAAMTLEEAMALTYDTNPALLAARAELRAVDESVSQAKSAWRPSVSSSLSAGITDQNTESNGTTTADATKYPRTGRPSLPQALYSGGALGAAIAGAESDVQAQRANLFDLKLLLPHQRESFLGGNHAQ